MLSHQICDQFYQSYHVFISQHQLPVLPPNSRHISSSDLLILEDELQRILLAGNICVNEYVTGVVLALLGHEDDSGKFFVEEVCPADIPNQVVPSTVNFTGNRYDIFVSYFISQIKLTIFL